MRVRNCAALIFLTIKISDSVYTVVHIYVRASPAHKTHTAFCRAHIFAASPFVHLSGGTKCKDRKVGSLRLSAASVKSTIVVCSRFGNRIYVHCAEIWRGFVIFTYRRRAYTHTHTHRIFDLAKKKKTLWCWFFLTVRLYITILCHDWVTFSKVLSIRLISFSLDPDSFKLLILFPFSFVFPLRN